MNKEIISQFLNHYLSLATIVGIVFAVLLAGYAAYRYFTKTKCLVLEGVARYVLPLSFLISFGGMILSLYYSEFLQYIPCDLCWFQRIFMYPQVFMLGHALYKKYKNVLPYSLILSCVGFAIAVYHHMLQIGYNIYKPCSDAPFAVDCAKPSFVEYGFVTFPLMAVLLFSSLILLVVITKFFAKK